MKEIESTGRVGAGKDFHQLIPNSFWGDDVGGRGELDQGLPSGGFHFKSQLNGKADGAEKAKAILGEAGDGISDGANGFGRQVGLACHVIEKLILQGVKKHSVDGEVASFGILFCGGEGDGGGSTSVEIGSIDPKGGDFENVFIQAKADNPEGFALGVGGFREEGLNLVGGSGGGDVDVGVGPLKKGVSNTASRIDGHVARLGEHLHNLFGGGMTDHFGVLGDRRVR